MSFSVLGSFVQYAKYIGVKGVKELCLGAFSYSVPIECVHRAVHTCPDSRICISCLVNMWAVCPSHGFVVRHWADWHLSMPGSSSQEIGCFKERNRLEQRRKWKVILWLLSDELLQSAFCDMNEQNHLWEIYSWFTIFCLNFRISIHSW